MKVIVLPVKDPSRAKQRVAPFLSRQERVELAWRMLEDVGAALRRCRRADGVVVVAHDAGVLRYAGRQGWRVIRESEQVSESTSVDRALRLLRREGVSAALRIPADIPLLQAEDVDALFDLADSGPALAVPSRDGSGTNALLRSPPDLFPSRFGPNSLELHQKEARRAGLSLTIVENERISLDLDEVADLVCFCRRSRQTRTLEFLEEIRLWARAAEPGEMHAST